jgi:hypothetical protein
MYDIFPDAAQRVFIKVRAEMPPNGDSECNYEMHGTYFLPEERGEGIDAGFLQAVDNPGIRTKLDSFNEPNPLYNEKPVTVSGSFTEDGIEAFKITPDPSEEECPLMIFNQFLSACLRTSELAWDRVTTYRREVRAIKRPIPGNEKESGVPEENPQKPPVPSFHDLQDASRLVDDDGDFVPIIRKKVKPAVPGVSETREDAEKEILDLLTQGMRYTDFKKMWMTQQRPVFREVFNNWIAAGRIVEDEDDHTLSLNE